MKKSKMRDRVKKRNGGQLPDERQQQFNATVLTTAMVFGVAFDLIMMVYHFAAKNIEKAYPYVAQLVIMSVGCLLASFGNKDVQPPTVFFGKRSFNTDKSTSAFFSRLAWCALDSLAYTIFIIVFDAYIGGQVTGSLISDGIHIFIIFTVMQSISCEIKVHRYRKNMALLDAEENDLND